MIVASNQKQFQPHPAGQFRAVCVDCTEPKEIDSRFGRQTIFKFVFETEATREDGTRFCAWSRPLTPSLHEKANLRKTLKQWRGKDLTSEELRGFDNESMVGQPAIIVVTHDERGDVTYANIVAVTPDKDPNPLQPPDQFLCLAGEHAPRDHFEPSRLAVHVPSLSRFLLPVRRLTPDCRS